MDDERHIIITIRHPIVIMELTHDHDASLLFNVYSLVVYMCIYLCWAIGEISYDRRGRGTKILRFGARDIWFYEYVGQIIHRTQRSSRVPSTTAICLFRATTYNEQKTGLAIERVALLRAAR